MKKIINGKKYDTETAQELGTWENTADASDFNWTAETLYQKRTGEFFIFGEGGPASRYAVAEGTNWWSGGKKILPLSWEAAREWAEEHLDADAYEGIFGEVTEGDGGRVVLSLSLDAAAANRARQAAAQAGVSLSGYVAKLIGGNTNA